MPVGRVAGTDVPLTARATLKRPPAVLPATILLAEVMAFATCAHRNTRQAARSLSSATRNLLPRAPRSAAPRTVARIDGLFAAALI